MRCSHLNDPLLGEAPVWRFTSTLQTASSDVSISLIQQAMLSDELDGSPQALVERDCWRPAHNVPRLGVVRHELHDLAQLRAQSLVILDDRLVDAHELKNPLCEPTD